MAMATRMAARFVSRRFSSGGKILGEEEKAAENVYIKKVDQEKLEKLARKGPKPEETPATSLGGSFADAKLSSSSSTSGPPTVKVSTDKYRNYAVLAGTIIVLLTFGWYYKASGKKPKV